MDHDTRKQDLLIFGYGSLIFKPMNFVEKSWDCFCCGFARRFIQSSWDHRGTVENPGRVVTMLPIKEMLKLEGAPKCVIGDIDDRHDGKVYGRLYKIQKDKQKQVIEQLDFREKAGYTKQYVDVHIIVDGNIEKNTVQAICFSASVDNEDLIPPPYDIKDSALHIYESIGPSGRNIDYFKGIYNSLLEMSLIHNLDCLDDHLREIDEELQQIKNKS